MNILRNNLDCGTISKHSKNNHTLLTISKFEDINTKIIPLFNKYDLIKGAKSLDYQDFCLIAELMKTKAHLNS
jgi:hypothetical protein